MEYTASRHHGTKTPFLTNEYRPKLEATNYCDANFHTIYLNITGMLRWMIELGRVDILHKVSLLSQYIALPRLGHLEHALNIFKYIKANLKQGWLVFDLLDYDLEWTPIRANEIPPIEQAMAMKDFYHEVEDPIPYKTPNPLDEDVNISCFVYSDHAGKCVTCCSHTGIRIYLNMAPIIWYSKRQTTVKTSTFGADLVALKIATELIESLRYKLRMMGVPLA